MNVLGVDPGASGGLALVDQDGTAQAWKVPATERDSWDLICEVRDQGDTVAVIERVSSSPQMGVVSAFTFGQSCGFFRGLLIAAEIPFEAVAPGVWQRPFSLPSLKAAGSSTKKKNAHKARAQELFPDLRITHAIADALLIAEYGRRKHA